MTKIAYLVFAYKNPRVLERAIKTLASEGCAFFVHIDRKSDIDQFSCIRGDNVFFSDKRLLVYWGEFSGVDAILLLIRQALSRPERYDYFVLLSGSDYPLRSGRYIHRFFEENQGSEFISMLKMPSPGLPISRISTVRFTSDKPVRRLAWRALGKLGLAERDYKKYLGGLEPYSGITWWSLSRNACEYVLRFMESNPTVERFFRNTFAPEETFFHTILGNSPLRNRIRGHLLFEDWSLERPIGTGARTLLSSTLLNSPSVIAARIKGRKPFGATSLPPRILTSQHVTSFEEQESVWIDDVYGRREALFARKFADDDVDLLDRLDTMIMGKEERLQCR